VNPIPTPSTPPGASSGAWLLAAALVALAAPAVLRVVLPAAPSVTFAASASGTPAVDAAAAHRAQLCSPSNPTGVGLRGEYFSQPGARGPVLLSRVDATVDFDATLDWPADRSASRPRSARWSGWIKAPFAGRYRIEVDPPSAQVTVGVQALQGPQSSAGGWVDLEPGRFYPIEVVVPRLPAPGASGEVALRWTAPHGARYVIPRNLLFMPTDTVKPEGRS
jgi:hypothetical protein